MEDETNVAPAVTSSEPAKTAEIDSAGGARAGAPGAPIAAADETPVSYPEHHHDVAQIDHLTERVAAIITESLAPQLDGIAEELDNLKAQIAGTGDGLASELAEIRAQISAIGAIGAGLADLRAHLPAAYTSAPGVPIAVPADAKTTIGVDVSVKPHVLVLGDPVKVWGDAEHATFRLGEISAVEAEDGPYEVTLDDGSVARISAAGLEYDYRR